MDVNNSTVRSIKQLVRQYVRRRSIWRIKAMTGYTCILSPPIVTPDLSPKHT